MDNTAAIESISKFQKKWKSSSLYSVSMKVSSIPFLSWTGERNAIETILQGARTSDKKKQSLPIIKVSSM